MAIDIERIKRDARKARREHGIAPTTFLNEFARRNGFHTWDSLLVQQRALPRPSAGRIPAAPPALAAPAPMHSLRKLLVLGINELLSKGLISLSGGNEPTSHVHANIAGRPSVILWSGIGYDELRVSVWWDYDHSMHPQANLERPYRECFETSEPVAKRQTYQRFVGAMASGWLERLSNKHLMGEGGGHLFDTYSRRKDRHALDAWPVPTAAGYASEGKFIF